MSIRRRLQPRRLRLEAERLGKKWTGRLLRRDREVLHLQPEGTARGEVLVSYVLDGIRQAQAGHLDPAHTHFWEADRVARTFLDLGYAVDAVHWQNAQFEPRKPYRAVVDVRNNLERWAPDLEPDCVKIFHGETAHWRFHDRAQRKRYAELAARRGVVLPPVKPAEPNRGIEVADHGFILGNDFTLGTYAFADTPLHPLSISTTSTYDRFPRRESSRRRFLWFGSGDLVHKGLDLVLEAVASRPHLELVVCGPIHREPAFERLYQRELYGLPNVRTYGWIDTQSRDFEEIATSCSALIYPSCSEGQCGGVITCMHAGLMPILTAQCGVPIDSSYGVLLPEAGIENIAEAMEQHAASSWQDIQERSDSARAYARSHHTRPRFAERYRELVQRVLAADQPGVAEDAATSS